jgi:hypothetical protein
VATGALALGERTGALPQAASIPTIRVNPHRTKECAMLLLLLEALGAGLLLIGIIWWTMFSGRPGGEAPAAEDTKKPPL